MRLSLLPMLAASLFLAASVNAQGPGRGGRGGAAAQSEADSSTSTTERFPAPPAVETTSKTKHEITDQWRQDPLYSHGRNSGFEEGRRQALGQHVLCRLYPQRRAGHVQAPHHVFAFNGGPGSASVWLHMGALGPKRVDMGPEGEQPKPPYHLVDNEDTALEFTDLVFIDPVSTGFSRPAPGENPAQFHSFEGDLQSVAAFIRLYLVRSERWDSPKFLAGESYGTTRASALSQYLLNNDGIYLNGITLISSVLNFETISFTPGNDLPYALFLPSYTAAAWYHKKLPKDLQSDLEKAVGESRRFAANEYSVALMKGDKLSAAERAQRGQANGAPHRPVGRFRRRIEPARPHAALRQGIAAQRAQDHRPLR